MRAMWTCEFHPRLGFVVPTLFAQSAKRMRHPQRWWGEGDLGDTAAS
jgi:hypothetical protein